MKTDIEYISSMLDDHGILSGSYIRKHDIGSIISAQAMVKLPKEVVPEKLYIINASALAKNPYIPDNINLACVEDTIVPSFVLDNQNMNLLLLKKEAYIPDIHSLIGQIHSQQKICADATNELIQRLYYGHGLTTVVEIAEKVFQNPVFIMDVSFRSLACSNLENIKSKPVKEAVKRGYLNATGIEYLAEHGWHDAMNLSNNVSLFSVDYDDACDNCETCHHCGFEKKWYNSFIKVNGCVVAHICVLGENRPLTRIYQDFLTMLAKIASMEYKNNTSFLSKDGALYETLLINLIENKITDQMTIAHLLTMLNKELKKYLFVVTVRKTDILTNKSFSAIEQENLRIMFPGSMSVCYKNEAVLLLSNDKDQLPLATSHEIFEAALKSGKLIAGVSLSFQNVSDMGRYYRQASKVIDFCQNADLEGPVFNYNDYSIYHALECCTNHMDLRDLCHPGILKLHESKSESDRELLQTLYLYLFYMKEVDKVTKDLNIHRSTLYYRLNKIKTLTDVDLEDGDVAFHLMFSFKLIEYMNIFSHIVNNNNTDTSLRRPKKI